MLLLDLYSISLNSLLLHKIRSLLTSLGIIFGVGSVIAMLAISGGAKRAALAQIEAMGIDNIIVFTRGDQAGEGSEDPDSRFFRYGLTDSDVANIRKMDNISRITTARDVRAKIYRGVEVLDIQMFWVSQDFLKDVNCEVIKGRWMKPSDYETGATVCVIGKNVKRKLFTLGEKEVIGRTVTVAGGTFRIIGVVENTHGAKIECIDSIDDTIFIPSTTGRGLFTEFSVEVGSGMFKVHHVENDLLIVKVLDPQAIDHTARRITTLLRKTHARRDWGVYVPLSLLRQKEATQNIFTIVMGSIAAISLIVGGVGIMNIMLANVYERRKEIGTRRAIGARKRDILYQFLIETVFLTVIGGVLGIGLGVGLARLITHFSGMPSIVSLWSIVGSLGISGLIGIVFGTYPAWQAANQNPIQALRAE